MGFWDTVASVSANLTATSRLDQLCRENGWSIDERHRNAIGLHFNGDRITPQHNRIKRKAAATQRAKNLAKGRSV